MPRAAANFPASQFELTKLGMPNPPRRATPIGPFRAVWLCAIIVLHPARFEPLEIEDEAAHAALTPALTPSRAVLVLRAFWSSLALVGAALLIGAILGALARKFWRFPDPGATAVLQLTVAGILLWATLFLRGWDIQTIGGVTLTERVNQW